MVIPNKYKVIFNNLIDNSNNRLDTKPLAMLKKIVVPSNNIPSLENNTSSLKKNRNFLDDRP